MKRARYAQMDERSDKIGIGKTYIPVIIDRNMPHPKSEQLSTSKRLSKSEHLLKS